jgi:serine/threonine protein kinase
MAEQTVDLVGTTLAERYHVLREIGHGAMGTVYEARHTVIGRRFAVKVLKQSCAGAAQRERFFHEARAAGALTHPHIVQVQDFGLVPSGEPYIVMEYVDGTDLQSYLEERRMLPVDEAVEIVGQILTALEVIHGAGLIHRDLKPANIMLARARRPRVFAKLLDFGIARAVNPAWRRRPDLTRVDQILGTPAYLSPEQAVNGAPDPRWDLWAMTTILYELLCGELPFRLESLEQVAEDIQRCRLVPLRHRRADLPGWVLEVVERGHHPVIERRFPTATAFVQALEQRTASSDADEGDARTVPFLRIELDTPPPELIGRATPAPTDLEDVLAAERPPAQVGGELRSSGAATVMRRSGSDARASAADVPSVQTESTDDSLTRPVTRSSADDLALRSVPLPSERGGRVTRTERVGLARRRVLYLAITALSLIALGIALYVYFTR